MFNWNVNGFYRDLLVAVKNMKYLLVLLLAGCGTKQYIVAPVNNNEKETNCIIKIEDKIFLNICKDIKL